MNLSMLVLRLTGRCNLNCAYCYAEGGPDGADMSTETALRAVELACPPGGTLNVQFTGGEPLLCWDLIEAVMSFGASTGRTLHASIQTNGTLLTPEICQGLKRWSIAVGVSLDGAGPVGTRPFANGTDSFPAVVRGLQTLAEAGMIANLMAVVTAETVQTLDRLMDFALWCGSVHGLGLDLVRDQGRAAGRVLPPTPAALDEGLKRLFVRHDLLERVGTPIRLKELERMRLLLRTGRRRTCYCNAQTGRSLAVAPDGSVWPCSALVGRSDCALGRLEAFQPSCPGLSPAAECVRCPAFGFCGGGCPAGRGKGGPNPLDCRMHRRFLAHACKLEGVNLDGFETVKNTGVTM